MTSLRADRPWVQCNHCPPESGAADFGRLGGLLGAVIFHSLRSLNPHLNPGSLASAKERRSPAMPHKDAVKSTRQSNEAGTVTGTQDVKSPSSKAASPGNGKGRPLQRFSMNVKVQGGHEHHLCPGHGGGRLSSMWRGILGLTERLNPSATLPEKYGKLHEVVGRGAASVVRISHKKMEDGVCEKLFAVKEFRAQSGETVRGYTKRLTAEFCISSALRHSKVVHTIDLLMDAKGKYYEIMEFCAGGDLYRVIHSPGKLEVQEADCFFKQMMCGVKYIHEMGVAHCDLKLENLLLTSDGGLKIGDFGNAHCFRMAWENDVHMASNRCGSSPYIAPEEHTGKEFDARAVDIWACGIVYMAMRTGYFLWGIAKEKDESYAQYLENLRDGEGYGPIESLPRVSFCYYVVLYLVSMIILTAIWLRSTAEMLYIAPWTLVQPDASQHPKSYNPHGVEK
ncbi:putative serine threonine-protein kinase hal4 [Fusarium acuminatum]|uniref:non-specific serine/threonine protein kinase n=1 Tax=Fusarium acuminatum TaxID=5515 RepID=A0ABZ2WN29_9HYPO